MRTHLIEFTAHPIEATLLRCRRGRGRRGRFLLQRQMESLMSPVLLRVPWINPIELDAQLEPPHRQVRQLRGPGRGKRRPVIGAQCAGQPEVPKRPLQPRAHPDRTRSDDPTAQHKPTAGVGDRQRITPGAIRRPKPSFEIGRPHIIRCVSRGQGLRDWHRITGTTARGAEAFALQQVPDRARRRPWVVRCALPQDCPQLLRTPSRMRSS